MKIPGKDTCYVEARSYVESPLVKEECEPLIDWIMGCGKPPKIGTAEIFIK